MGITLKGKIEKRSIRLPEWIDLPDGTDVVVNIEHGLSKKEKIKIAKKLCGAWADDPSIDSIFRQIEEERHSYSGRTIDINATP